MKRVIFTLNILLLLVIAGAAGAQTDLEVDFLQVQMWPEYDRPSMLVIYSLELSDQQPLPAEVTVRIPASVGEPEAVTVLEADNVLRYREYTRSVDGEWAEITMLADFPFVQIEYYDPALSQQDSPRTYDFSWVADYNVGNLIVSVKQPVNATGMNIQPSLGVGSPDAEGLMVYASSVGPVPASQTFDLTLSYNKNDTLLATDDPEPSSSIFDTLPSWAWALVGAGVLLLAGGGIMLFRSNKSAGTASSYQRKKQRSRSRSGSPAKARRKSGVFCHQCGTQASSDDKFCRECGTKLRL